MKDKILFWFVILLITLGIIALISLALRALGVLWMYNKLTFAIIILDIVAILMTAGWVIFGVYRGVDFLEVFYNYVYVIVVIFSYMLNIYKLKWLNN